MTKKKIPTSVAVTTILVALAAFADFAYSTINAPEPIHKLGADYCTKCHSDAKTLAKMKDKADSFWVDPLPPNHPKIQRK